MEPARILVVRLGAMGDLLHAMPAVATVRRRFPRSRISWAVHPKWRDLLEGGGLADESISLKPPKPRLSPHGLERPAPERFDLVFEIVRA